MLESSLKTRMNENGIEYTRNQNRVEIAKAVLATLLRRGELYDEKEAVKRSVYMADLLLDELDK